MTKSQELRLYSGLKKLKAINESLELFFYDEDASGQSDEYVKGLMKERNELEDSIWKLKMI